MKYSTLGFLASGRGSNMQAIVEACKSGVIAAVPKIVISNNSSSEALRRGASHGLRSECVNSTRTSDVDARICDLLQEEGVELLILAGYMKKVGPKVLAEFSGRIINIHPSLLPRHGGEGLYGIRVHEAVIASGDRESGASVHLVTEEYDEGAVISQSVVEVAPDETPESLASKVLEKEHELFVKTVSGIVSGAIVLSL